MAYERLVEFAARQKGTAIGARAALALGYYDYSRAHFTEARSWFEKAAADPLLADYAMFWEAQNDRAAGAVDIALVELKRYRERYPDTAMSDSAVEALAQAAIEKKNEMLVTKTKGDLEEEQEGVSEDETSYMAAKYAGEEAEDLRPREEE